MKLEIKRRVGSAWGGVKKAAGAVGHGIATVGRGIASAVTPDRESVVIRRKGKHLKIRNGATRADITYTSSARAKEVVKNLIGSTEEAVSHCPLQ